MAWFIRRRLLSHALCLYIQFLTYLRPGEVVGFTGAQLIQPAAAAGAAYQMWGINVAPFEAGRPGKTGLFDESLMIDSDPWLSPLLIQLKLGGDERRLWPFTLTELAQLFAQAVQERGLGAVRPTLYSICHGGASEDLLRGRRDIDGVFRRGRWRAWSSLRRYGNQKPSCRPS